MKEERQEHWTFIDFLCINQNDVAERGHQVRLMRQVYEDAAEVVAWMGTTPDLRDNDSIDKVERTLTALDRICRDRGSISTRFVIEDAVSRGLVSKEEMFADGQYSFTTLLKAYTIRTSDEVPASARLHMSGRRWLFKTRERAAAPAKEASSSMWDGSQTDDLEAADIGLSEEIFRGLCSSGILRRWLRGAVPYGGLPKGEIEQTLKNAIVEVPEEYILWLAIWESSDDEMSYYTQSMIAAFLQRDYWSRAWIVQEVASAKQLTLRFRSLRLRSEHLSSFVAFVGDLFGLDVQYSVSNDEDDSSKWLHDCQRLNGIMTDPSIPLAQRNEARCMMITAQLMNFRKPLYESDSNIDAKYRRINLLTGVCNWSMQECKERFDRLFGIMCLTDSQLVPSYTMSSLDLFLRIMTEGILESDRNDAGDDPKDHWLKEHLFCCTLLSALQLDIWHPMVDLTTSIILGFCQESLVPPARANVNAMLLSISFFKGSSNKSRIAARLRTAATLQRLQDMPNDQILKSPCSGLQAQSVGQWKWMAVCIVVDVFARVVDFRERRGESERPRTESITSELNDRNLTGESTDKASLLLANIRHSVPGGGL